MKTTIVSNSHLVKGFVEIDLKYITCLIEFNWSEKANQLNLRLEKIKYKIKDPQERRMHAVDYLKPNSQSALLKRVLNHSLIPSLKKKPNIIWYKQ